MENRTRRRIVTLCAIFGGALLVALIGQGLTILKMGEELRALRGKPAAQTAPVPAAQPMDPLAAAGRSPWFGRAPFGAADWDPAAEIREMQRLFDEIAGSPVAPAPLSIPELAISDQGKNYVVRVGVPGEDAGKVNVRVDGRTLTVNGTYTTKAGNGDPKGSGAVAVEESQSFSQTLELPGPVDTSKMQARRENGVVTIVLPKSAKG